MTFLHGESVTFLHPSTTADEYHNQVPDWSAPIRTVVDGVGVEPRPAGERTLDARNATVSGFTLYLPPGVTSLDPLDRVEVRGRTLDVDGDVADWRSPFTGWAPGSVVQTKVVTG